MSMHLFKVTWLVFVSKQTERLMQLQFKGPNYKAPFGALGEVLAIHFHHVAVFFPERASQGATASGFRKYGSVPDFSSLLIFKWNEKTPKPFSFGHSKKIPEAIWRCSVTQSCLTLCDPTDCSTPVFPIHHHLPQFAQTYVHWVGDAI